MQNQSNSLITFDTQLKTALCLADISDHLRVFCTIANKLPVASEIKDYRDFSRFDEEAFLNAIANVDYVSHVTEDVGKHE